MDVGDWALAMVMVGGEGAKRKHSEGIRMQTKEITDTGAEQTGMRFLICCYSPRVTVVILV